MVQATMKSEIFQVKIILMASKTLYISYNQFWRIFHKAYFTPFNKHARVLGCIGPFSNLRFEL